MVTWSNLRMDSSEQEDQFHPLQGCWARKRTISPPLWPQIIQSEKLGRKIVHLKKTFSPYHVPSVGGWSLFVQLAAFFYWVSRAAGKLPEFTPKPEAIHLRTRGMWGITQSCRVGKVSVWESILGAKAQDHPACLLRKLEHGRAV